MPDPTIMKGPSRGVPETLKAKDEILNSFLSLLDQAHQSGYKELLKFQDLLDPSITPEEVLDFFLFEKGIAVYEGYMAQQKRDLLDNAVEIDTKRFTQAGLALFVSTLIPNVDVDVSVPIQLNQISFRNPTIGFPNAQMRLTAGRATRDINPYIVNLGSNRELGLFLFGDDATAFSDEEFFNFLGTVVVAQLPDIIPNIQYKFHEYIVGAGTVEVNGTTVTGSGTSFTTHFQDGGFIGLRSASLDNTFVFKIGQVVSNTSIDLVSTEDTSDIAQAPSTVTYYRPL